MNRIIACFPEESVNMASAHRRKVTYHIQDRTQMGISRITNREPVKFHLKLVPRSGLTFISFIRKEIKTNIHKIL
jgi:hypothetical protein